MRSQWLAFVAIVTVGVMVLSGCGVPQVEHNKVVAEKDALQARVDASGQETLALEAQIAELQAQVQELQMKNAELETRLTEMGTKQPSAVPAPERGAPTQGPTEPAPAFDLGY